MCIIWLVLTVWVMFNVHCDSFLHKHWHWSGSSPHCRGTPLTYAGRNVRESPGITVCCFHISPLPPSLLLQTSRLINAHETAATSLCNPDLCGLCGWRDEEEQKRQRGIQTDWNGTQREWCVDRRGDSGSDPPRRTPTHIHSPHR